MTTHALVLHSGGMDSTTCLAIARDTYDEVTTLGVDYGQRHIKELDQARKIQKQYAVEHIYIKLPDIPKSMLTDTNIKVPDISYDEIEGISPTYVPFRNGQLLSAAAGIAQANDIDAIFFGAHSEDAANWAYPDCTPEFIGAMANAIYIGTYQKTRLVTPLMWLDKADIVKLGTQYGVPWNLTWSCYRGEEHHCGVCPTCRSRKEAFLAAGVIDPTTYSA